jgi:hypothetical protein
MDEFGTVETIIRANRGSIAGRLLLKVALMAVYVAWVLTKLPSHALILISIPLLAVLYVSGLMARLLYTGVAAQFTDRGVVDRTGGLAFVAWSEIRGVELRPYQGQQLVELDLFDVEPVIERLGRVRRFLLRWYMKRTSRRPYMQGSFVLGGGEALVGALRARLGDMRQAG